MRTLSMSRVKEVPSANTPTYQMKIVVQKIMWNLAFELRVVTI